MSDVPPDDEAPEGCTPQVWGGCQPLVTEDDLCGDCSKLDLNDEDNNALFQAMLLVASERFVMATRGRFTGCCTTAFRATENPSACEGALLPELAAVIGTGYEALPLMVADGPAPVFLNCWGSPSRPQRTAIHLPYLPVREVLEVQVDSEVLPEDEWYLVPGTNLLRRNDGAAWRGDIDIVFRHGNDAPPSAKPLIAMYACELAKRCTGAPCELPEGIKVLSRPGVQFGDEVILDTEYRREGLTGYRPLDDWIRQVFAGQSKTRPRMWRPRRR